MVYLINKITQIAIIIMVVLILITVALFAYVLVLKKKRVNHRMEEEDFSKIKFRREDVSEYVKSIEDICDDMIVTDNGRRFVAVLKCVGHDFFYEPADQQLATVSGMYAYTNTITKPTSYRQYSKPVDLAYTLEQHNKALSDRNEELFHVQEDIRDMETNLRREAASLSKEDIELYEREIAKAKKSEKALLFRIYHLKDEIRAVSRYTSSEMDPEYVETWVYEWSYNPYDFSYDMNAADIHYRAVKELFSIGQTKIHALANCGVKAKRCTTDELIDMCRRYSAPISSERYKMSDVKESSYFDDITQADPYSEARQRVLEELEAAADMATYESLLRVNQEEAHEVERKSIHKTKTSIQKKKDMRKENSTEEKIIRREEKAGSAVSSQAIPAKNHVTNAFHGRRQIVRATNVLSREKEKHDVITDEELIIGD